MGGVGTDAWTRRLRAARDYALAAFTTVAVIVGRLSLDDFLGHHRNRHLVFLPTVMFVAWQWGLRRGLFSALLFTIALRVFWYSPKDSIFQAYSDVVLFLVVSGVMCAVIESLRMARQRADAETRSREQVLAVVAHDLANPLHAVKLAEERLRDSAGAVPAADRSLQTIRRATSRMEHLIRDLVDSTRLDHGDLTVAPKPEPAAGVVQEVADLFSSTAQDHGVTIEATAPPPEVEVDVDHDRLMQVLGNLIGNALKFTPQGGRVSLRAIDRGSAVTFEVQDTGRGIEPEHLPHIFERYRTYDGQGTGLGLFIAQRLVGLHGASLHVESEVGHGARFWFEVPRHAT